MKIKSEKIQQISGESKIMTSLTVELADQNMQEEHIGGTYD